MLTLGFWSGLLLFIGVLICPIFTIGCILVVCGYNTFGIIIIVLGVIDIIGTIMKK